MRKSRKSDYIILALVCLITLNIGSGLIEYYASNKASLSLEKNRFAFASIPVNYLKDNFSMDKILIRTIGSLYPMADIPTSTIDDLEDDISVPTYEPIDEELDERGYNKELDIIIENLEGYESLILVKDSDGTQMVENIPEPLMLNKIKVDKEKPYILMYHTHATEAYLPSKADDYRTSVKEYNIVGMGDIISTVLEANNHKVDHVETYHDLPSYNQSYSRSLNTIRKKQDESGNLKILLDIHRNAVRDDHPQIESLIAKSKVEIDGKSVAKFSLVVGPDSDNYDKVLSFAKYVKAVSDALYPDLCEGIIIKPIGKYNQYLSDYSALLELGYHFHTIEEVTESAKLVGEVFSVVLNSIIEE